MTEQKARTIDCRMCGGERPLVKVGRNLLCGGCGTFAANARNNLVKKQRKLLCPSCHHPRFKELEPGRYLCNRCSGVFEHPDGVAIDDRPVQNAEKLESIGLRGKGR